YAPDRTAIQFKSASFGGSNGDCNGNGMIISSDEQVELKALSGPGVPTDSEREAEMDEARRPGSGWVATQKSGFTWGDFERISDPESHTKPVSSDSRNNEVSLARLGAQVKSRWSERERPVVDRLPLTTAQRDELKKNLGAKAFSDLKVQSGEWSEKRIALFYFSARKISESELPFLRDHNGDDSVVVDYRG